MLQLGWLHDGGRRIFLAGSYPSLRRGLGAILCGIACATLGACSSNLILSSGPKPRVENCMLLQQATPTRYVCDGKTYTAVELAHIRNDGAPAQ